MVRLKYPSVPSTFNITCYKHHASKTVACASVFQLNVEPKHVARFSAFRVHCTNLYRLEFGRSCSNSCGSTRFPASSFMPNLERIFATWATHPWEIEITLSWSADCVAPQRPPPAGQRAQRFVSIFWPSTMYCWPSASAPHLSMHLPRKANQWELIWRS